MYKIVTGSDENYREAIGFNNSLLNAYAQGLRSLRDYWGLNLTEEEKAGRGNKQAFRKGSAVDCLLTQGEEAFHNQFFQIPSYSDYDPAVILMKAWINLGNKTWDAPKMEILSRDLVYTKAGEEVTGLWRQNKWEGKDETQTQERIAKRIAKFDSHYNKNIIFRYLRSFGHKTYITAEEYAEVKACIKKIKADPYTQKLVDPGEDCTLYTQLALYYKVKVPGLAWKQEFQKVPGVTGEGADTYVMAKGLLDYVYVDHKDKTIRLLDLKTTSKSAGEHFTSSMANYGYIGQDSLYSELAKQWAAEHYPEYKLLPFQFIISGMKDLAEPPLVFELGEVERTIGKYGGSVAFELEGRRRRVEFRGWVHLMRNLIEQMATGQYYLTPAQLAIREMGKPQKPAFEVIHVNAEGSEEEQGFVPATPANVNYASSVEFGVEFFD